LIVRNSNWHLASGLILWLALPLTAFAQKFYTYVGDTGPNHVLIAWGTATGANTIGRSSDSHGPAVVKIDGREIAVTDQNWTNITGLKPDTDYPYEVSLEGKTIGKSQIRTWPLASDKLRFFVIGDFGNASSGQNSVAAAMHREFQRHDAANPVRFILTTGDNFYGTFGFLLRYRVTGDEDSEWRSRFFTPYEPLISRIPFYPTLGNHDGNESEGREDLATYLDNFFFPAHVPSRYYRFSFGGLADFFALDSTSNSETGPPKPIYLPNSEQHKWLLENLGQSRTPWKIPYMHHPPFNAGPGHPSAANDLGHFMKAFQRSGVKVVFSGHEHNFQFSRKNAATGNIRYLVTGAGGELRRGNVRRQMKASQIEGWAPVFHFLSVEIEGKEMRITPIGAEPFDVVDANGEKIEMPLRVTLD
jgi:tartrate-resistant acid phosphatase type 5